MALVANPRRRYSGGVKTCVIENDVCEEGDSPRSLWTRTVRSMVASDERMSSVSLALLGTNTLEILINRVVGGGMIRWLAHQ